MGKINVLQPNVFNMLSAGEVVERPSSVVKELVENSLDAGATSVDVYVENGGIRKIQVSDNGIGILKEDIRTAFMPHATSKLSQIDDLDSLSTLGFRGEALASIASVSEVTLISASKIQRAASKIVLNGGNVVSQSEDSRNEGTIITVENLFFNTPARLKFLKKPTSEMRQITDTVRMLVLANPSVSFTLADENGEILSHEGGSLADAVCSVYGAKTVDRLLAVNADKFGSVKVSGFVSACDFTKPNRTYQTVIVNGRAVEDSTVQTAVEKAYGDYLMKRAYPMFVLDIVMPFDEVDANVHPSKTEVRFLDSRKVFGAVYHAVKTAVDESVGKAAFGFDLASDIENPSGNNRFTPDKDVLVNDTYSQKTNSAASDDVAKEYNYSQNPKIKESAVQTKIDTHLLYQGKNEPKCFMPSFGVGKFRESIFISTETVEPNVIDIDEHAQMKSANAAEFQQLNENAQIGVFDGSIIGQVFSTYLLVERDNMLYVIDQHAAHERILYDRIVDRFKAEYSQPLLVPYRLSLTGSEEEYLERILPSLLSLGFEIKREGYTYTVKSVPEPVSKIDFTKFFGGLFANMLDESELTLAQLLKESLCQQACKAAIKGGETLSREQIQFVIRHYVDANGTLPTKCPHGRPAVIALDKRDFEKMFKRIV